MVAALPSSWPEPVQRVQHLGDGGPLQRVPDQYVRPRADRPALLHLQPSVDALAAHESPEFETVPVLDMADFDSGAGSPRHQFFLQELRRACQEWGFLQLRNHGLQEELLDAMRRTAGDFFKLPIAEKQRYANDPLTYQGYGSRLGVSQGAVLDWGDYFFVSVLPPSSRDLTKWPTNPFLWRNVVEEYCKQMEILSKKLLEALSLSLHLQSSNNLHKALGELDMGLRINYYPPCPQPELTLGLSPHSDPGGLTLLLQDPNVPGLQVKKASSSSWVTIPPLPGALVVNLGDQLQILTNGKYKSVEHRVVANKNCERLSIACFINPSNDTMVSPLQELISKNEAPAYNAMTFKKYRSFIRDRGTKGKEHLDAIASPTLPSSHIP